MIIPHELLTEEFTNDVSLANLIRHICEKVKPNPRKQSHQNNRLITQIDLQPFEFLFSRSATAAICHTTGRIMERRIAYLVERGIVQKLHTNFSSGYTVYKVCVETFFGRSKKAKVTSEVQPKTVAKEIEEAFDKLEGAAKRPQVQPNVQPNFKNSGEENSELYRNSVQPEVQHDKNDKSYRPIVKEKERAEKEKSNLALSLESSLSFHEKLERINTFELYATDAKIHITRRDISLWVSSYSEDEIVEAFGVLVNKKTPTQNHAAYVQNRLSKRYAAQEKLIAANREFAQAFKDEKRWYELVITKKYCRCSKTGHDFQFNLHSFKEMLAKKHAQWQGEI